MWQKIYFSVAILFFLVMNVLLWRSEFGNKDFSVAVPVETVVGHILESADDSNLEIQKEGVKIGYCRWSPGTISLPSSYPLDPSIPEGMVSTVTGYEMNFDGSVSLDELNRLRFNFNLHILTNYLWKQVQLRLHMRPWKWELQAQAQSQSFQLTVSDSETTRKHEMPFSELENPGRLLQELGAPWLGESLGLLQWMPSSVGSQPLALSLEWDAQTDRQKIGRTLLSVYRIHTRILDQYDIVIYSLKSGEILRVELPGEVLLLNDELMTQK